MSDGINGIRPPAPGIDPNQYAANYAKAKNVSLEEAKTQLRAQYGEPIAKDDIGVQLNGQARLDGLNWTQQNGPHVQGDPDPIGGRVPPEASSDAQGKTNILNMFMDFLHKLGGDNGPQVEGDPDFSRNGLSGPTKAGDPDPKKDDPDVAAQKYADEHNITLQEAKEELKRLYGDPQ